MIFKYIKNIIKSNTTSIMPDTYTYQWHTRNTSKLLLLHCRKFIKFFCFWTLKRYFSPRVLHTCASVLCEPLYHLLIMSPKFAVIPEA